MKKQLLLLVLMLLPMIASADDSGTCGNNVNWSFVASTGTLTITGTGAMTDFANNKKVAWHNYINDIKEVTIGNGITNIGNISFYSCKNLISITIPNSVAKIGNYAF